MKWAVKGGVCTTCAKKLDGVGGEVGEEVVEEGGVVGQVEQEVALVNFDAVSTAAVAVEPMAEIAEEPETLHV